MSGTSRMVEAIERDLNSPDLTEGRMLRKILREINPHISLTESEVLMFIFDRTYSYGKTSEYIPMRHFLEGVRTGAGELLHPPVRFGRSVVYDALKNLSDNVIVLRSQTSHNATPRYAINPVWEPQVSGRTDTSVRERGHTSPTSRTHNKKNNNTQEHIQVAPACAYARTEDMPIDAVTKLRETLAATSQQTAAARDKRKKKLNASALMKIWQDAFTLHFPEDRWFTWRTYELAGFKKAIHKHIPLELAEEFVTFCVKDFPSVIQGHFGWMKQPPLLPNVGFVTKQIERFFQAFEDDRDPNRRVRARIRQAPKSQSSETTTDQSTEVEALKAKVAKLEGALGDKQQQETVRKVKRFRKAKALVSNRAKKSEEFGTWED